VHVCVLVTESVCIQLFLIWMVCFEALCISKIILIISLVVEYSKKLESENFQILHQPLLTSALAGLLLQLVLQAVEPKPPAGLAF
jgi:hypothetical protein